MKFIFLLSICLLNFSYLQAKTLYLSILEVSEESKGYKVSRALADEITLRSGVKIVLLSLPAKRAERLLSEGVIDGDFARVNGFGKQVENLIQIPTPINSLPYIAYSTNKNIKIDGWKSLADYRVIYPRGWKVIDMYLKPFHKNLSPIDTPKAGLKFIERNRADIFINIPFSVEPLLKTEEFINSKIQALQPPIDSLNLYIYILPKYAKEASRVGIALKSMKKDGTQDKILSQ